MIRLRSVLELALGDFRERARRYSFLVTLGAAAYLAYTVHAGWWLVRIDDFAPEAGAARLGALVAVATAVMLSLVGFYVVKGSVERDRRTGVGPILAATPVGPLRYASAKFLSNLAVLGSMLAVLAALALAMAGMRGPGLDGGRWWRVLAPSLFLAGPTLAAVAGLAVAFDSVPWLRGTGGNVLYFFLWVAMLGASITASPVLDVTGLRLVHDSLREALLSARPAATAEGLTVQLRPDGLPETTRFAWSGVAWTFENLAWRGYWVVVGAGLTGLSSLTLRLFDPFAETAEADGGGPGAAGDRGGRPPADTGSAAEDGEGRGRLRPSLAGLPPAAAASEGRSVLRTAAGELRLLATGHAWWWYAVVAAANLAALFLPADSVSTVLLAAWLMPLSAWSSLGARERIHGTEQLLFSSPGPRRRQLPAQLAAGVGLALLCAAGPIVRHAAGGDVASLAALGAGAFFVPAMALCLGVWSGGTKLFEALYVILWYLGPASGVPFLDYAGVTGRAVEVGATPAFLLAGGGLAALAWLGRGRRLRAVG